MVKIGAELPKLSQNLPGYPFFGLPWQISVVITYCLSLMFIGLSVRWISSCRVTTKWNWNKTVS